MTAQAVEIVPVWRTSTLQRQLVTVTAVAGLVALVLGRGDLVLVAAPLLGALAGGWLARTPRRLRVRVDRDVTRCFEDEQLVVRAEIAPDPSTGGLSASLQTGAGLAVDKATQTHAGGLWIAEWRLRAIRWGRWPVGQLVLDVRAAGGLLAGQRRLDLGELSVYPRAPEPDALLVPATLVQQLGEHVSRAVGQGSEFTGVRPHQHGLPLRRINWSVTSRRQRLYVNEYGAERAIDLVVIVDAYTDVGPAGSSSLDLAARGACALAQAHLRRHDRAGAVVLGGGMRWLRPDLAQRQYYRIVEHVLDRPRWMSVVRPDIRRVPRTALPPGALVVVFSPLLDERAVNVVRDLRGRGFPVLVIDVLNTEPPPEKGRLPELALRLWRLDREALHHALGVLGVPVLHWDGREPLGVVLARLPRDAIAGVRP